MRNRLKPYQKSNGSADWICAQKRPIDALQFLLEQYRTVQTIPDYVVLIDDDTYINMNHLVVALHDYSTIGSDLLVLGGCVTNFPYRLQFKFPNIGFGSIFSKAAIQNLLRPIHCNRNNNAINDTNVDPFTRMACWRLYEQNHFNELKYFVDGMSVSDIMYNYTKSLSFLNVDSWEHGDGFCFEAEHALAYFVGFYHVAVPDHVLLNAEMSDDIRNENPYGFSEIVATIGTDSDFSTKTTPINQIKSQCTKFTLRKLQ